MDIQQAFDSLSRIEMGKFLLRNDKQLATILGLNRPDFEKVRTEDIVGYLLQNMSIEDILDAVVGDRFGELKDILFSCSVDEYLYENDYGYTEDLNDTSPNRNKQECIDQSIEEHQDLNYEDEDKIEELPF